MQEISLPIGWQSSKLKKQMHSICFFDRFSKKIAKSSSFFSTNMVKYKVRNCEV